MTQSCGSKSATLGCKLHRGVPKSLESSVGFGSSTVYQVCAPAWLTLYHMPGSCKRPIACLCSTTVCLETYSSSRSHLGLVLICMGIDECLADQGRMCRVLLISSAGGQGVFHRRAKLFELSFFLRKTFL